MKKLTLLGAALLQLALIAAPVHAADLDQEAFKQAMQKYLEKDENLDTVGTALETYYKSKRQKQQQAAAAAERNRMEEQFNNPVKIDIGDSPVMGKKDAPVTIIEFSDFQCPYCGRGKDTMHEVAEAYPDQVKIVFKHLPLPFHPQAKPAARASIAAQKQGKFWEMHDKLFENQKNLSDETYIALANELGLDIEKFKRDFNDPAVAKMVDDDAALAATLGVQGTPGFFVNGVQVRGAKPFPQFKILIDRWLSMKGKS